MPLNKGAEPIEKNNREYVQPLEKKKKNKIRTYLS